MNQEEKLNKSWISTAKFCEIFCTNSLFSTQCLVPATGDRKFGKNT